MLKCSMTMVQGALICGLLSINPTDNVVFGKWFCYCHLKSLPGADGYLCYTPTNLYQWPEIIFTSLTEHLYVYKNV